MPSWLTGSYSGGTEATRTSLPRMTSYNALTGKASLGAAFASSGSVDAGIITRLRYDSRAVQNINLGKVPWGYLSGSGGSPDYIFNASSSLVVEARIRISAADRAPYNGSGHSANDVWFGLTAWIAAASDFPSGYVPTPQEIRVKAFAFEESQNVTDPYVGPSEGNVDIVCRLKYTPYGGFDKPGKKWIAIAPALRPGYGDFSETGTDTSVPGGMNTLGRALSFYTDRAPLAPAITSPASGSIVPPDSTFPLTIDPNHPDEVLGGSVDRYNKNLSGVQVQYSARPTPENPTPAWLDMPITNSDGTAAGSGWAIDGSTAIPANSGAFNFLSDSSFLVRAGSNTLHANEGQIPAGEWQFRVRTFDYGHPSPAVQRPKPNISAATLTPLTIPPAYISPWSETVSVLVPSQVPPPIPISPLNNVAIPEGEPVTLTYQYRNTAVPPFAQAHRVIEMRKVGEPDWTVVADEDSASSSYTVAGYPLEATTMYEWRVQVKDTTAGESNFSEVARFWVVPAPVSGNVRPVPTETVDGATLGCGKYTVEVYRRGGKRRVGVITNITYLDWSRKRDDISTAQIKVRDWTVDCGNLLASLHAWAYEIRIIRDNGYSVDQVWEGPITLPTYETNEVTIDAKDVMVYPYRRIIKQRMNDTGNSPTAGDTVTRRAARVLQNVMAPDDPNVLAYLNVLSRTDDAKQYRSLPAYSRTAFEEIDDMAANAGLDYTVVGRSILLWGTKHRIGTLPEFHDDNFGSPPIVSEYGMSMANRYVVSDGNGVWGEATRLDPNEEDENYGLVEMLSSSWASDSPNDSGTYTQAGLQTVIESFEGYAERSISDRYMPGPPVVVRVPDNTSLNANTLLSIQQLVPGVVIPLRSTGTLREVVANQKLDSVKVTVTDGEEKIEVTMSPFSRDDNATEVIEA